MPTVRSRPAAAGQLWRPRPPVRKTITVVHATAGGAVVPAGRRWEQVAVVSCQVLMLLTATALSVFKPRGRVGGRRARS
ncbi:hypothetical protein [Actinomadura sp. WMMA1423]|uniref:hypothetical protein n=1 Tax=Actinomadura sp. WMMA1423 TaxID=2591108 RepID=UPI001146A078|nr:hypothetical protein [Actinomadura sp. WMMA1423]